MCGGWGRHLLSKDENATAPFAFYAVDMSFYATGQSHLL
jgi:hypothetical protein